MYDLNESCGKLICCLVPCVQTGCNNRGTKAYSPSAYSC
uniref:Uncharacterized protein n=1 Tax=Anguilla anguilla TaxID=7936 RepID=A0A0E9RTC7_ANGAN